MSLVADDGESRLAANTDTVRHDALPPFPKERRPGAPRGWHFIKKASFSRKWLGRHVADNFADLAAGQGEGYSLLGIRQILRAKKAVKDLSRTNTRVQSTA
jgi:hypothetical protein